MSTPTAEQRAIVEKLRDDYLAMAELRATVPVKLDTCAQLADALTALLASPTPAPLDCVCQVPDGLVQEWVSKARSVAKSKGFDVAARALAASPAPAPLVTREQLASIEWVQLDASTDFCPACDRMRHGGGHEPDCWLARALTAAPAAQDERWRMSSTGLEPHPEGEWVRYAASPAPSPPDADDGRDPIVMAADAAKAACIRRLQRASATAKRIGMMPLNADECATLLEHWNWSDELPLSSSVALEPGDPSTPDLRGQAVQRVAVCQMKDADRRDGCSELVALRLVLKCADRACDSDNIDSASDYVREALRHVEKLIGTPAAPSPSQAGEPTPSKLMLRIGPNGTYYDDGRDQAPTGQAVAPLVTPWPTEQQIEGRLAPETREDRIAQDRRIYGELSPAQSPIGRAGIDQRQRDLPNTEALQARYGASQAGEPIPPCPACVSEYGSPRADCPHCGGSGRCPSAPTAQAVAPRSPDMPTLQAGDRLLFAGGNMTLLPQTRIPPDPKASFTLDEVLAIQRVIWERQENR